MKLFVISDFHGNENALKGLEAAIRHFKPDKLFFLGDIFGYYYSQGKVIDFLWKEKFISLLGNHDRYALDIKNGFLPINEIAHKYGSSYLNIYNLSIEQLNWIESLPSTVDLEADGLRLKFVHGNHLDALNGRFYPNSDFDISNESWDVMFCGHTHVPFVKAEKEKTVINVGSVGQPRDGENGRAVIYNTENRSIQFITIDAGKEFLCEELTQRGDQVLEHYRILLRKYY